MKEKKMLYFESVFGLDPKKYDCVFLYTPMIWEESPDKKPVTCKLRFGPRKFIKFRDVSEDSWEILYREQQDTHMVYQRVPAEMTVKNGVYYLDLEQQLTRMGIPHGQMVEEVFDSIKQSLSGWSSDTSSCVAASHGFFCMSSSWMDTWDQYFTVYFADGFRAGSYPVQEFCLHTEAHIDEELYELFYQGLEKGYLDEEDLKQIFSMIELDWSMEFRGKSGEIVWWHKGRFAVRSTPLQRSCRVPAKGGEQAFRLFLETLMMESDEERIRFLEGLEGYEEEGQ